MCIRRETREKDRRSLAFPPVSKPHTHITYMLRQCTSIVYIFFTSLRTFCILQNKIKKFFFFYCFNIYISINLFIRGIPLTGLTRNICVPIPCQGPICHGFFCVQWCDWPGSRTTAVCFSRTLNCCFLASWII